MDSFWIYVIIAIIYVITRALKKPENPKDVADARPDRPVNYDPTPPSANKPKPLTFEELLREITEAKQPPQPSYETRRQEPEYVDYDDNLKEEEEDLEEVRYNKRYKEEERVNTAYEQAKLEAFNRPSLEETLKVSDTQVQFGKFKAFDQQPKRNNVLEDYTINFQDSEGLKRAVVMSEILKRKF
jgi:hypothetical protein